MLLLGIDTGTSSIKVSVVDAVTQRLLATAQYPETEADIISLQPGWAEQSPDQWWENIKQAILKCHATGLYEPKDIAAIGIAYQMHGLVLVDANQHVLRNAIIWCDSRAVETGEAAFQAIGEEHCLSHLLNSPGNFTAAKLAWVKQHEPELYSRIRYVMLPGDFVSMKLTGEINTTVEALSEGIFWDFKTNSLSEEVLNYFGFDKNLFPEIHPVFAPHGYLKAAVADRLGLRSGIPVAYKSGDQPNNALSLNVLHPGEVAATAGTSGVIYGVSDQLAYDKASRINTFAHVNHHLPEQMGGEGVHNNRTGILLCINGVGIFNKWIRNIAGSNLSYAALNDAAAGVPEGAEGLIALPFGNGAERMLNNRTIGGHLLNLDFNQHTAAHTIRAVQEGIAFAFRYGLDIMRENGIHPTVVRAGKSNLFLSEVFTDAFVETNQVEMEFYEGDGSFGAAIGAGIGAGIYPDLASASGKRRPISITSPSGLSHYEPLYQRWKAALQEKLDQ